MIGSSSVQCLGQGEDSWDCHRCDAGGMTVITLQFHVL